MTDRAQFEAMLEALINEDQEAAKEIFHNIVVAKSREIYEELLAEGFEEEEEEGEEEEEEEEGEEEEESGDATDDFATDFDSEEDDDVGGEEGDEDLEDRVMDLEDALEELKAEFDSLMADEANEPEHNDGVEDPDFGEEDEFGGEEDEFGGEEDEFGGEEDAFASTQGDSEVKEVHHFFHNEPEEHTDEEYMQFMEYVNKVALPKHGDNGVNTKSIVASKNDMGGTTANIAKNFSTTSGGTQGGLLKPSTTVQDAGNQNKPGANVGKTAFKKQQPGHGAEKKGKGESAPNPKSIIGSRK